MDVQAGVEAAVQVVISALSGASLVHDVGFLDCADIGSLSYLVLVDEIVGMAKRIMRGIEVTPETIMLDLIEKVGPGGMFLNQAKSASLCRREVWVPTILDRNPYNIWEQKGTQTTEQAVNAKLMNILATHQPVMLSAEIQDRISEILRLAEARELRKVRG